MLRAVFLDSGPLGQVTQRRKKSAEADACRLWLETLLANGVRVYVPEIADYEVRRELIRTGKTAGITRLNRLKTLARYLPITTDAMLKAAELWADARNRGVATADIHALDVDVILAAQALTAGLAPSELIVASVNVRHLSRYVASDSWRNIVP
jgi:predicted nucleic acid-binding protein